VYNERYDQTNTSKSLLRALKATGKGGVLWMNGDVDDGLGAVADDGGDAGVPAERGADVVVLLTHDRAPSSSPPAWARGSGAACPSPSPSSATGARSWVSSTLGGVRLVVALVVHVLDVRERVDDGLGAVADDGGDASRRRARAACCG
jgi:hypothetical protein